MARTKLTLCRRLCNNFLEGRPRLRQSTFISIAHENGIISRCRYNFCILKTNYFHVWRLYGKTRFPDQVSCEEKIDYLFVNENCKLLVLRVTFLTWQCKSYFWSTKYAIEKLQILVKTNLCFNIPAALLPRHKSQFHNFESMSLATTFGLMQG